MIERDIDDRCVHDYDERGQHDRDGDNPPVHLNLVLSFHQNRRYYGHPDP